jgi:hypothetical protein
MIRVIQYEDEADSNLLPTAAVNANISLSPALHAKIGGDAALKKRAKYNRSHGVSFLCCHGVAGRPYFLLLCGRGRGFHE